jgi:dihydroorotase
MMKKTIIRSAQVVNEGKICIADVLIANGRIEKIASAIELNDLSNVHEVNAEGLFLMPGVIDDQVHFREPGLTYKGDLLSESIAAVAGGVTSFMDMPNTIPNTLSLVELENKYDLASSKSLANYSFFMGMNEHNLEEVLRVDNRWVCGISDDGLYFNNEKGSMCNNLPFLEQLFSRTSSLVSLHCEDDTIIQRNTDYYTQRFGEEIPFEFHPVIRSEEACLKATKEVLKLARKSNVRFHLLHVSTLAEANLFDTSLPVEQKRITAEACVHHLWFCDEDYKSKGAQIKWNPAIKTRNDRDGLLQALKENRIDIIATDHAPHDLSEKGSVYAKAHSGGPLIQHSLVAMLEFYHKGLLSVESIAEKMSHNVALLYKMIDRGFIREGYWADLVLVDLNAPWKVTSENIRYKCKWSPFEGQEFRSKVVQTYVNGELAYDHGCINRTVHGKRLEFLIER